MKEQLILALDLGTQSARAILIDKKGTIIDKEQRKYNPVYNSPVIGYCEQDPNVYFNYLVDACKTLTNNHQDLLNDIIGVVLTTFRDTAAFGISEITDSVTVVVSEETGRISIAYNGNLESVSVDSFLREFTDLMSIDN